MKSSTASDASILVIDIVDDDDTVDAPAKSGGPAVETNEPINLDASANMSALQSDDKDEAPAAAELQLVNRSRHHRASMLNVERRQSRTLSMAAFGGRGALPFDQQVRVCIKSYEIEDEPSAALQSQRDEPCNDRETKQNAVMRRKANDVFRLVSMATLLTVREKARSGGVSGESGTVSTATGTSAERTADDEEHEERVRQLTAKVVHSMYQTCSQVDMFTRCPDLSAQLHSGRYVSSSASSGCVVSAEKDAAPNSTGGNSSQELQSLKMYVNKLDSEYAKWRSLLETRQAAYKRARAEKMAVLSGKLKLKQTSPALLAPPNSELDDSELASSAVKFQRLSQTVQQIEDHLRSQSETLHTVARKNWRRVAEEQREKVETTVKRLHCLQVDAVNEIKRRMVEHCTPNSSFASDNQSSGVGELWKYRPGRVRSLIHDGHTPLATLSRFMDVA